MYAYNRLIIFRFIHVSLLRIIKPCFLVPRRGGIISTEYILAMLAAIRTYHLMGLTIYIQSVSIGSQHNLIPFNMGYLSDPVSGRIVSAKTPLAFHPFM